MKLWGILNLYAAETLYHIFPQHREKFDLCRGGGDFARLLVDLVTVAIAFSEHVGIPKSERDAALAGLRDQLTKFLTTEEEGTCLTRECS